jgi:hypothetical protein
MVDGPLHNFEGWQLVHDDIMIGAGEVWFHRFLSAEFKKMNVEFMAKLRTQLFIFFRPQSVDDFWLDHGVSNS